MSHYLIIWAEPNVWHLLYRRINCHSKGVNAKSGYLEPNCSVWWAISTMALCLWNCSCLNCDSLFLFYIFFGSLSGWSVIRISRKGWHILLNVLFHTAMTFGVFAGGINQIKYPIVCQVVSLILHYPFQVLHYMAKGLWTYGYYTQM